MNTCTRCIMPHSFPNVTFENGICSLCIEHGRSKRIRKRTLGRDKLSEVLTSKQPGEQGWDCAVPLSGGKDSSYILFYIVRELGLRPLALFFDNGFVADMAKRNVHSICDLLSVDLVIGKATHHRTRLIKEAAKISSLLPKTMLRGHLCSNCENDIRTFSINESSQRGIPFVVWGATDFEDTARYVTKSTNARKEYGTIGNTYRMIVGTYLRALMGSGLSNMCRLASPGLKYLYYTLRDNVEMKTPEGWRKFNPFLEVSFDRKDIEAIYFFDYIDYDPFHQTDVLQRELDWESPPDNEMRMDCRLHIFGNYWSLRNTGLTSDGFILATLVRNGLLSREDALRKETVLKQHLEREYHDLLQDLDVDLRTVQRLTG